MRRASRAGIRPTARALVVSRLRRLLPLMPALFLACAPPAAGDRGHGRPAIAGERTIPLATVDFSGRRFVARADFGLPETVPLMVHGNARVFLSLTHGAAEKLNGGPVAKVDDYGYSPKGKGTIDVPVMALGGHRFERLLRVPVFDFTEDGDTTVQGMLGTRFLIAARAAVDFSRDALVLGVATSLGPDRAWRERGYEHVRMRVDPDYRVTIDVTFPGLGRAVPITPSTVSSALTLHRPLFDGRVPMRKAASPDRSPSGTSPDEFVGDSVAFEIAGTRFRSPATFEDLAEYGNVPEAALESYGMLGYDWMAEHEAVLDYANRILYFKP